MRLITWNCQRGFGKEEKYEKLVALSPDLAVIQECVDPKTSQYGMEYEDAIWAGKAKSIGLGVFSFSSDYQLSLLTEEITYDWVLPIKVTGKDEEFILIAVWTKRSPEYASYGSLLYAALQEYEDLLQHQHVIIAGDFNLDKKLPASYKGIQGKHGFDVITGYLQNFGFESCYHYFSKEDFGTENKATYYHHKKLDNPFHIDYCFVSKELLPKIDSFTIEEGEGWLAVSDHSPLVVDVEFGENE